VIKTSFKLRERSCVVNGLKTAHSRWPVPLPLLADYGYPFSIGKFDYL
jgi:hypothetical protein